MIQPLPRSTLFPYTTLFRSQDNRNQERKGFVKAGGDERKGKSNDSRGEQQSRVPKHDKQNSNQNNNNNNPNQNRKDRKSTRLNSSHVRISYAVFCLKKKKKH